MTELILSDITRMAGGHCIIGMEKAGDCWRSIRPLPPQHNAWPASFQYKRGDRLLFKLEKVTADRPHLEDMRSTGVLECKGRITEEDLLEHLRKAEVAKSIESLFGCKVTPGKHGAHLHAPKANRSICGADVTRLRLKCEGQDVRGSVRFAGGESLMDLPVVDRSWYAFLKEVQEKMGGPNRAQRLNLYLENRLGAIDRFFVRIGLTRPHPPKFGRCQVMLDTILPMPRKSWVDEYVSALQPELAKELL